MTNQDLVREWHEAFDCPVLTTPTVPSEDRVVLRETLLKEEAKELLAELNFTVLARAFGDADRLAPHILAKVAKECCDVLYIVYGTALEFGFDLDEVMREVHRSNMSKLGEDGQPIRREDGKILKGPNYFEPDVEAVLAA